MKEYLKPDVEFVDFAAEAVMDDSDPMNPGLTSSDEVNPYG